MMRSIIAFGLMALGTAAEEAKRQRGYCHEQDHLRIGNGIGAGSRRSRVRGGYPAEGAGAARVFRLGRVVRRRRGRREMEDRRLDHGLCSTKLCSLVCLRNGEE